MRKIAKGLKAAGCEIGTTAAFVCTVLPSTPRNAAPVTKVQTSHRTFSHFGNPRSSAHALRFGFAETQKKARLRRAHAERRRRSAYGVRFIPKQKHQPRKELRSSLGGSCGFQFLRSPLHSAKRRPCRKSSDLPPHFLPLRQPPQQCARPAFRLRRARAERRRRSAYGVRFTRRQSPLLSPLLEQPTQAQQI